MQEPCSHSLRHRYSTISSLHHLFSNRPTAATVAAAGVDNAEKPSRKRSSRPQTAELISKLINSQSWSSSLESSLSSFSPISQINVLRTLYKIYNSLSALQFFDYAQNSGFPLSPHSYNLVLYRLCKSRFLSSATNFLFSIPERSNGAINLTERHFTLLIRGYGEAGFFMDALKVFWKMKAIGVSPSVYTFNELFVILLKRGRTKTVYRLYDEMLKTFGVKPDLCSFNILIRGFCKNKMVGRGYWFFKEMGKFDCRGDVVTFNTIIDGLCRDEKLEIARNVLEGMTKKGLNLSPNVVTYTTLIRGYCDNQQIDEAWDVLEEMMARGVTPNGVTYNTLIQGLCEAGQLGRVKEILEKSEGFAPDTFTFNVLIKAHCDDGNLDEAKKVFDNMTQLNVQQDSASYSVLIRCFCQSGFPERAEELLDELLSKKILKREVGCTPLVGSYNPVFEYLCKSGKTLKAQKLFKQLMRRGRQNVLAFKILILGHCLEGAHKAAHKLLKLMVRMKFVPDLNTYESLIDVLLKKSEYILAYETLQHMLKDSHIPRASTYHFILAGLHKMGSAHEAASLMNLMLEKKISPTIYLSTDTMKVLFKNGLREEGFKTYDHLHKSGYMVNMEELVTFLCQEMKLIEAYELLLHSIKNDGTSNLNTCSMVITALCKSNRVSEAFKLYYEVIDLNIPGELSSLEDLSIALKATGKLAEAKFLAKRMVK